jgi:hypothetical protein
LPKAIAARLSGGLDLDEDFDHLYPDWGRRLSTVHWTPVAIARRAAQWLVTRPGTRVLDVGAGVGKFALVGSLVTDGVFYGIEQRRQFVNAAQAAAGSIGAKRAHFLHGNMMALDWKMFDAFYLYNPFLEDHRFEPHRGMSEVEIDVVCAYIEFVQRRLLRAPVGTRVATYHGFGGDLPSCYQLQPESAGAIEDLEFWIRCAEPRT